MLVLTLSSTDLKDQCIRLMSGTVLIMFSLVYNHLKIRLLVV